VDQRLVTGLGERDAVKPMLSGPMAPVLSLSAADQEPVMKRRDLRDALKNPQTHSEPAMTLTLTLVWESAASLHQRQW
jgi:hypothetical protein